MPYHSDILKIFSQKFLPESLAGDSEDFRVWNPDELGVVNMSLRSLARKFDEKVAPKIADAIHQDRGYLLVPLNEPFFVKHDKALQILDESGSLTFDNTIVPISMLVCYALNTPLGG